MFDFTINIVSLTTLGLAILSGILYIERINVRASAADARASAAEKKASDAADDLESYKTANDSRHNISTASIALIREQFVRKEELQHLEASMKDEFRELNKRLDSFFRDFAKRGGE